jgi:hypothetical protein
MADIPSVPNVPSAAAMGAGAAVAAEAASVGGAIALLTQLQQVVTAVMSNPALGGIALQSIGSNIQNFILKNLRETVRLTTEQNRQVNEFSAQARKWTMLAGTVGSFSMKVAQATVEIRRMGMEMVAVGRLNEMPGGGMSLTDVGRKYAAMKMGDTWDYNAKFAEAKLRDIQRGWAQYSARKMTPTQIENVSTLAAAYGGSGRGNLVDSSIRLMGQWGGKLTREQAFGFIQSLTGSEEKSKTGYFGIGQNVENMVSTIGALKESGIGDFDLARRMAMTARTATFGRGVGEARQENLIGGAISVLGSNQKMNSLYATLANQGLYRGSSNQFASEFRGEDALVKVMDYQRKVARNVLGGKKNYVDFDVTQKEFVEKFGAMSSLSRGDLISLGDTDLESFGSVVKQTQVSLNSFETDGVDLLNGKFKDMSKTLIDFEKSLGGFGDKLSAIKQGFNLGMSHIGGGSDAAPTAFGLLGLGSDLAGLGIQAYMTKKAWDIYKAGKVVTPIASGVAADLTVEQALAKLNQTGYLKPGGAPPGALGKFGKVLGKASGPLSALLFALALSETANAEPSKGPRGVKKLSPDILNPDWYSNIGEAMFGSFSDPFMTQKSTHAKMLKLSTERDSPGVLEAVKKYMETNPGMGEQRIRGFRLRARAAEESGKSLWDEGEAAGAGSVIVQFVDQNGGELGKVLAKKGSQQIIQLNMNQMLGVGVD